VVDDEDMIKQFLREELEDEGYRILLASSGKEALSILNEPEKPDLIILDLRMREMNGIEMMGYFIKARHEIPVIVFTAYGAYRDEPLLLAADAYVMKSSDTRELKQKVRELTLT
jgi:CheY-like chemotaxis protein